MNPVRIPRHNPVRWPRWPGRLLRRLANSWRAAQLRARINQMYALQARIDLWAFDDEIERDLIEARLNDLYCELAQLCRQAEAQP